VASGWAERKRGTRMAGGSEQRREERGRCVEAEVPEGRVEAALDPLHLAEVVWHDCSGPAELALSAGMLEDGLADAGGSLVELIRVACLAVTDFRVSADAVRCRAGVDR
jgi:hypothetical protein